MPEASAVAGPARAPPAPQGVSAGHSSSGGDVGARAGADVDPAHLTTVALQPDASPKLKLHLPTPPLQPAPLQHDPPSYALASAAPLQPVQSAPAPAPAPAPAGASAPASGAASAANSVSSSPAPSAPATPEQHHELVAVHVDVMPQPLPAPLGAAPAPPGYTQQPLGSGYGYGYNRQPQYVVVQPSRVYIEDDATCAQCGCAFAVCFPIVGCVTYCVNADAPFGTQRRKWARLALSTALIAFILGILLVWFTSAPPDNQ